MVLHAQVHTSTFGMWENQGKKDGMEHSVRHLLNALALCLFVFALITQYLFTVHTTTPVHRKILTLWFPGSIEDGHLPKPRGVARRLTRSKFSGRIEEKSSTKIYPSCWARVPCHAKMAHEQPNRNIYKSEDESDLRRKSSLFFEPFTAGLSHLNGS